VAAAFSGRHGPLSWSAVAVNQTNTLVRHIMVGGEKEDAEVNKRGPVVVNAARR